MVGATPPLWIPALTLTPALSQWERGIAELWGWELRVPSERPGLISLTGATYPGSESGTCFRAKTGGGFASLPPPLWIPAFAGMTIWGGRFCSPSPQSSPIDGEEEDPISLVVQRFLPWLGTSAGATGLFGAGAGGACVSFEWWVGRG